MSAMLASFGVNALIGIGLGVGAVLVWLASVWNAKARGVAQQKAADTAGREAERAKVDEVRAASGLLSDSELDERLRRDQRPK